MINEILVCPKCNTALKVQANNKMLSIAGGMENYVHCADVYQCPNHPDVKVFLANKQGFFDETPKLEIVK